MQQTVSVALVGAGGYGTYYLNELLSNPQNRVQLVGVVDPYPERCRYLAELQARDIPVYPALSDFLATSHADMICIASPIQLHMPQTIASLESGASVLCEKPLCATIQDARRMAQAEAQAPGFVAIGYQWSFSGAIQALKADIMRGDLGRPVRLKSRVYWPRPAVYYGRNQWAGRVAMDDGTWVLDSPAGNAAAHYLHNMLYVLGEATDTSAQPVSVQAELFRANPIENYDTAAIRVMTDSGAEILFYATHATENTVNPIFEYAFEEAVVHFNQNEGTDIVAQFHDGRQKVYGDPFATGMGKIWQCVDAVQTGQPVVCGIRAASAHTLCVNGAQESAPAIVDFPLDLLRTQPAGDSELTFVDGLETLLTHCYETNSLLSESGLAAWAVGGRVIDLQHYDHFPQNTAL